MEGQGSGEEMVEGNAKRIQMCYVHEPTRHDKCNHYVLHSYTIKNFKF